MSGFTRIELALYAFNDVVAFALLALPSSVTISASTSPSAICTVSKSIKLEYQLRFLSLACHASVRLVSFCIYPAFTSFSFCFNSFVDHSIFHQILTRKTNYHCRNLVVYNRCPWFSYRSKTSIPQSNLEYLNY